jgi:predicted RNA-binding Zn ribbon-like protein
LTLLALTSKFDGMVSSNNVNYTASGVLLPLPLAGDVALELCNTYAGWGESAGREYLAGYAHLVTWACERGLVEARAAAELAEMAERDPPGADRALTRARRLRAAFYAVATGEADDAARAIVAREVERAAATARVEWHADRARFALPVALELPVLTAAQEIGRFITQPPRVGRCPGHGCGWLFTGGRGRRRWCSMAVCGNRAKVRRHAQRNPRKKPSDPPKEVLR